MQTPTQMGYRMPAEWEPHSGTWLSWPKNPDTFGPEILPKVEQAYERMVLELSRDEEVKILVDDEKTMQKVGGRLHRAERASFVVLRTEDVWVRDYGPTYVKGDGLAVVKWGFNAWGNKYDDLLADGEAGEKIAESTNLPVFRPGIVLEGGSIDTNAEGKLLTTEQCLLNPNRNPSLARGDIERVLKENVGVKEVVWLKSGIEGDDTDGHIDDVARFVSPRNVLVASQESPDDPDHASLEEAFELLDKDGSLEVERVPMPPRLDSAYGRLPASHLNFYIGNGVVLIPIFGGASDKEAMKTIESAFPTRRLVGLDCRALVHGLGTIHCVTQQIPR
jgi:agmatine deiminase